MNLFRSTIGRASRGVIALAVLGVLTLGACGSDSKKSAPQPKDATTLLDKAMAEHLAGKLPQAEQDYTQLIRSDPQNKYAYYNLGLIFQTEHRAADAENQYRLVLTIDTKYEPALYNLALLRTAANDPESATDLYRRAIAVSPKDANARFNLGLLLLKNGKTLEGDRQIQQAVALDATLRNKATAVGVPLRPKS